MVKKKEVDEDAEGREMVGLDISYMNFQEGKKGVVKPNPARGEEIFHGGANIFGPGKTKIIANLTPQVQGEDGVVDLYKGDPENETIGMPEYCLVVDGKEYWDDAIAGLDGFEVNNHEANSGFTPRIVIEGVEGPHTVAFKARSGGFTVQGKTLFINRH